MCDAHQAGFQMKLNCDDQFQVLNHKLPQALKLERAKNMDERGRFQSHQQQERLKRVFPGCNAII